jgi:hypothetical protein
MNQSPSEVFAFMSANKVGEKVALFWIAWAFVEEKNGNIKVADQTYVKGLRYLAEPRDLLNKRYHQFQRRMTRKYLSADEQEISDTTNKPSESRLFGGFSGGSSFKTSSSNSNKTISSISNVPFAIFDDKMQETESQVNAIWPSLGTEAERRKENDGLLVSILVLVVSYFYNIVGPVTKWSGEGGLGIMRSSNSAANALQPFQIFVENEFGGTASCVNNPVPEIQSKEKTANFSTGI